MKNILICAAALCLFTLNVFAENKIHGSNEFSVNYNNLDGPGKTSSSLTQGARYLENLNLYGNGSKNSWNYNYSFGLKATDDKKNDLKTFSLTNLNSKITNNIHTLNTGDVFESFTRYSLGSPLKGLSYNLSPKNKSSFNITALHGIAYPRWDSFWGDPEVKTVKRTVSGIRTKKILTDDIEAGFNYVFTKDTDRQSSSDGLYDAKTYSFDFEYDPMPGLTVNAERAQSDSDYSSSAGTAYSSSKGHATRIEAIGDGYPSRVVMEYENVSPYFISLLGSAISDRRKFKSSWRYNYSKKTTMNWSFLWYRNNLDSQLTSTTRSWKPQIGIAIKRIFPKRRYSFVDFYYKFDQQYGAGQSSSNHYL